MNALTRRVSRLEGRMGLSAESKAEQERWRAAAEKIWEAQRRYMTKEELIIEEQKMAFLREATRGCHTIAETLRCSRAALQEFEAKREGKNE